MRGKIILGLTVLGSLSFGGCMIVASPVAGGLYTDVKGAVDAEGAPGGKEGKACATSILGWVGTGDASIAAASSAGGVKKITAVDHTSKQILGIWGEYCTVVRGE